MKMMNKTYGAVLKDPKYYTRLIIEGILIGLASGFIVSLYRFALTNSENIFFSILSFIKEDLLLTILWFVILVVMGIITGILMKWEPISKGSGIPQVIGEVKGYYDTNWWKVLITKFIGGTIALLVGLPLGREGPSVQLGAMAAKGVSKNLNNSKTCENRSIICGSGAGIAATFNAPISGVLFTIETISKSFDKTIIFVGLIAVIIADLIAKAFFGQSPIFKFSAINIPLNYYWILIVLGAIMGFAGYVYNTGLMTSSNLWDKINIPLELKFAITFIITGIIGLFIPDAMGGGHQMMYLLEVSMPPLSILITLLIVKYLLLAFCFGSGTPGGIFYPVLVIGAYIGAIFSVIVVPFFGLNPLITYQLILIAMAAMLASSVRTPITAVVLVSEMSGISTALVGLVIVTLLAYTIPTLLGNDGIYDSILNKLIANNNPNYDKSKSKLEEYIIPFDCEYIGEKIWNLPLPQTALVVSVVRNGNTLIPDENMILEPTDELFIIMNYKTYAKNNKIIEEMFYNK